MLKSGLSSRTAAAQILQAVIGKKQSLNSVLSEVLPNLPAAERSLCQQLCYGSLRLYPTLQALSEQLLQKKLKNKDQDIFCLLLLGLYQLRELRIPAHAAISETVNSAAIMGKTWAKGLLNACLRQYQRRQQELEQLITRNEMALYAHPQWMIDSIRDDWPDDWSQILQANNLQAPMMLRVNQQHCSISEYQQLLAEKNLNSSLLPDCPQGLLLEQACDVALLPGFSEGLVSVQDGAAQQVAALMDLQPGLSLLDACAAPGGKTAHFLELEAELDLLALDIDAARLLRVQETLQRLGLHAETQQADASDTQSWYQGGGFDRILIDAPCSGTGVIRRHPDIKLLRRPDDIASLATRQQALLENLWPLLKPGGLLVYTTCSALKQENEAQIGHFLQQQPGAIAVMPAVFPARKAQHGNQRLPGDDAFDGFYYACLRHR